MLQHCPKSASLPSKNKTDKVKVILAGALEVFTTHGYASASMDRIAAAANVSKPTLYRYFQDKEGLFVALIQQLTATNNQILFDLSTEPNSQNPPEKALRHLATSVLEKFSRNEPLSNLMRLIIGESERFPGLARTFVREIQKPLLSRLSSYLAAQPQLHLPDPPVAARIFVGSLVHYLLVQNVMHGSDIVPLERDRMIDGLIHLIMAADKS
ncbi:MAG: TetR/AcrR family transcriptional regulator [Leptolyngbyaceae cyanobacterium SM1_1_3]|nr:TetR/AcrR family transcriptional regulator [Leptolyngbyaceae cyanobacterium SM1_1_3]